jgi:hypothetical protein
LKKEVFLERAFAIHGDKFDYSLVPDEFGWKDKVTVMCEVHGQFLITAANHISNRRGCPACGAVGRSINNRDSLEDVILQVKAKHPLYNVDYTSYVDKNTVLKVNCEHGHDFSSSARDLLCNKYGCPNCALKNRGLNRRKSVDEFLNKSKEVHGDRYDYSSVNFISFGERVEIICKIHGSFYQTPTVHIKGHGCKSCAVEAVGELKRKTLESTAPWVFKDPNITPLVSTYIKATSPMSFICAKHGMFSRVLTSYKEGCSICKECNAEHKARSRTSNTEDFIEKAKLVFPEYDYSNVIYTKVTGYIDVVCAKGHSFSQRAGNLLQGFGCPSCSRSGFSYDKKGYLYVLSIDGIYGKIGISNKYSKRIQQITNKAKVDVGTIAVFEFDNGEHAKELEYQLLSSKDIEFSVMSKVDVPDGYTETFYLKDVEKVFDFIKSYRDKLS